MKREGSLSLFNKLKHYGHVLKIGNKIVFFGDQSFQYNQIEKNFFKHSILKQVHGSHIIEAPLHTKNLPEADGHWTIQKNLALIIKTADCMPVFLLGKNKIGSLHIGWRGLKQKILSNFLKNEVKPSQYQIFVGPHIGYNSFELDKKNAIELLESHDMSLPYAINNGFARLSQTQNIHYYLNLKKILMKEAQSWNTMQFNSIDVDTYTSSRHYSHRRNRWRTGTNLSLTISLKGPQ